MQIISQLTIHVNDKLYLKHPESSDLGKKILSAGIDLMDELGFEQFTFKKLGQRIDSPEASIYRYFDSKQKLLLYYACWHWAYLEYELAFSTANITSPQKRLELALDKLLQRRQPHLQNGIYNLEKLDRIVIAESSKTYLHKEVDEINQASSAYAGYKKLVARLSDIILEINPGYHYPHMLISTVIEGAHMQRYFADHLPRLTDIIPGEDSTAVFYKQLVLKAIS